MKRIGPRAAHDKSTMPSKAAALKVANVILSNFEQHNGTASTAHMAMDMYTLRKVNAPENKKKRACGP